MSKPATHGIAFIGTIIVVAIVFTATLITIYKIANPNPTVGPNPHAKTEVKGIVTLKDDVTDRASDLAVSNAISNVAADCKGRVMVDRGNYLVTVYCSPSK